MNQAIIEAKKAYVAEIAEKMKNAESTVVVEYRGLTVAEMTELRRELRAEDVEFKVYKNALAQRAVESIGADGLKEVLVGPNAIAFGKDATAPAREIREEAREPGAEERYRRRQGCGRRNDQEAVRPAEQGRHDLHVPGLPAVTDHQVRVRCQGGCREQGRSSRTCCS